MQALAWVTAGLASWTLAGLFVALAFGQYVRAGRR